MTTTKRFRQFCNFGLTVVLASVFGTNYASPSSVGAMFGSDGSASTATAETLPRSIYETVERGTPYTVDYRIFIKGPNGLISPWHDIPLYANESAKIFNMIVEIPRWTSAKMEMATKELFTPIRQDENNGELRFVNNVFPYRGYIWNYGALPQTWEDPSYLVAETQAKGDCDPIDAIEIGTRIQKRGAVIQVKIVGTLALIDDGATDWKLVAIDVHDALAPQINAIGDVEKFYPGLLRATHEWFRTYKIPTGKPANQFGFNGQFKDRNYAHSIIADTHEHWKQLMTENAPSLSKLCRSPEAQSSNYSASTKQAVATA